MDNIKKNISHIPCRNIFNRVMRTSGNKMINSIENIKIKNIPEKDTIHPGHNKYLKHPFRMKNKENAAQNQSVWLRNKLNMNRYY